MFPLSPLLNIATQIWADPTQQANYWQLFILQVIIILIFVRVFGKLMQYIKQPRVIGEIIAGIVVGPSVLGQSANWSYYVFPSYSWNYFTLVGDIGLILFMFILGLELDEKLLKKQWKSSVPIATMAIIIPFGLGLSMADYLYDINNSTGFTPPNYTAFVLFTGSALSFTAFPVLASILSSTGLLNTPLGIQSMSCAAIDDIMAWVTLAIASAFAKGNGIIGLYVLLISVGYVLFMFLLVRPMLAKVHDHYLEKNDELNRSFLLIIFLSLLSSAFFCESLGIHSFFGAFVAGIISPKKGKFAHVLFPQIELVTTELLLPLFFASSGMRTNIGSISSPFLGGITVMIWAVSTGGKFLPAFLMTKIVTKRDWTFSACVGILMNTRGLVELIALNIGLSLGILSQRLFTIYVVMALATTFMTAPILWILHLRHAYAGRIPLGGGEVVSLPLGRGGEGVDTEGNAVVDGPRGVGHMMDLAHDTHSRLEIVRAADEDILRTGSMLRSQGGKDKFGPVGENNNGNDIGMTTGGGVKWYHDNGANSREESKNNNANVSSPSAPTTVAIAVDDHHDHDGDGEDDTLHTVLTQSGGKGKGGNRTPKASDAVY